MFGYLPKSMICDRASEMAPVTPIPRTSANAPKPHWQRIDVLPASSKERDGSDFPATRKAGRLVRLHRDLDSFNPHGEERGQRPCVSNHGRTCGILRDASLREAPQMRSSCSTSQYHCVEVLARAPA